MEKTAITFEYDVPSVEDFRNRMKNTMEKFPYLVAELNGKAYWRACARPAGGKDIWGDSRRDLNDLLQRKQHLN